MAAQAGLPPLPLAAAPPALLDVAVVREAHYLVFGGGGARGIAYVGWAQAVADMCGIDFGARRGGAGLRGVAGASIGALFAFLIALGYSTRDLEAALADLQSTHLFRVTPRALLRTDGAAADDGTALRATLARYLHAKLGAVYDVTLAELEARTGVRLVLVATDRVTCAVQYLSAATAPSMSAVSAAYASMALPLLYAPLHTPSGAELMDGGCMDNLPLGIFPPHETLTVGLHWNQEGVTPGGAVGLGAYLTRAVYCAMYVPACVAWASVTSEQRWRAMVLELNGVPTVDLDVGPAFKNRVREQGYAAAAAALHRMARGEFPRPPTRGFGWACPDALPHYARRLVLAALEADTAWLAARKAEAAAATHTAEKPSHAAT